MNMMIRHTSGLLLHSGKSKALRCLILLSLLPTAIQAHNTDSWQWKGLFSADHRMLLKQDQEWAWNENRLDLSLTRRTSGIHVFANTWIRHLGPSMVHSSADLKDKYLVYPLQIDIREAYAEVYDFLLPGLDLKIGRQYIAWGTADRFNPTNTLGAYDLEDVLDMGRLNASDALSVHWHLKRTWSLQVIAIPVFRPANMPVGYFSSLFQETAGLPGSFQMNEYSDELLLPANNPQESGSTGVRLRGFALNADFSISYTYNRNSLPLAKQVILSRGGQGINVHASLIYPRQHVIGADVAGSIGQFGAWAELAVFLPEKEIQTTIDMNALYPEDSPATTVLQLTALKKEAYLKCVAGTDYTFRNGTYINLQYLYGFFHENGRDNTTDYLLVNLEKTILQNKLLLKPLAGGVNVSDRTDIKNNHALFLNPEISYIGRDNLTITAGAFLFYGKGENLFAKMKQARMITLALKLAF
jgi:hypothetical protein